MTKHQAVTDSPGNASAMINAAPPIIPTPLQSFEQHQEQPRPYCPVRGADTRAGQLVQRQHGRFAGVDSMLAEFELQRNFYQTTNKDHPQRYEPRPGAENGRCDELSRTYNGSRQNQTRTEKPECLAQR